MNPPVDNFLFIHVALLAPRPLPHLIARVSLLCESMIERLDEILTLYSAVLDDYEKALELHKECCENNVDEYCAPLEADAERVYELTKHYYYSFNTLSDIYDNTCV